MSDKKVSLVLTDGDAGLIIWALVDFIARHKHPECYHRTGVTFNETFVSVDRIADTVSDAMTAASDIAEPQPVHLNKWEYPVWPDEPSEVSGVCRFCADPVIAGGTICSDCYEGHVD